MITPLKDYSHGISSIIPFRRWVIDCNKLEAYIVQCIDGQWRGKCICKHTFSDGCDFRGDILQRKYPSYETALTDVWFTARVILESIPNQSMTILSSSNTKNFLNSVSTTGLPAAYDYASMYCNNVTYAVTLNQDCDEFTEVAPTDTKTVCNKNLALKNKALQTFRDRCYPFYAL